MFACVAAQVKVRQLWLGLLWHRLYAGHVSDNSATEGSICADAALYICELYLTYCDRASAKVI